MTDLLAVAVKPDALDLNSVCTVYVVFALNPETVYDPVFAFTVFDVHDPHVLPESAETLYRTRLHVRSDVHFMVMLVSVFDVFETVTVG